MAKLSFIADDDLKNAVEFLLDSAYEAFHFVNENPKNIYKNVIDPFAALFEMSGFNLSCEQWINNEKNRQAQKTLQNHIGSFHQKILGSVPGWVDLATGKGCDIVSEKRMIIAEIKNKYNTVSGGKLKDVYDELDTLVMLKNSKYKGFTAYYVPIINKKPDSFDKPFTPPDKSKGKKKEENPLIRTTDGRSFYHLVTGVEDALDLLYQTIPEVIGELDKPFARKTFESEFCAHLFKKAFLSL